MNGFLRLISKVLAFADQPPTSNPGLRFVDWSQDIADIAVVNPRVEGAVVPAGQTKTVFDGTRTLTIDGTTDLDLSLVDGTADRYRFEFVGGTDPTFRTDRALTLSGNTVTVTVNDNGTAVFTFSGGSLAAIQVGDVLWVPTEDDIASQVLGVGNQGFWNVLAKTSTTLTLARDGDFQAEAEGPTILTANDQVRAFSAAGVQVGDGLDVTAGFVATNQKSFRVVGVTSLYLEIESSAALAEEAAISPGAAGFTVYTAAKRFLRLEADQECAVLVNGDTGSLQRVVPWSAGDPKRPGVYERSGLTWKLQVVSRSSVATNLVFVAAE